MIIEEATKSARELAWFKSTYSSGAGGECIEVAKCPDTVRVRDSKISTGPVLSITIDSWSDFVGFARQV
ncbi:DUF397 domain-containing protein [Streptomyces sp. NBC_01429]|uniref:DUF397 domain-containing protein n=1 Tax=Streptomyces sp. NBC_01429 TaxID=2903862 RepID=UPI002E2E63FB|nr:DUF397 domain-containing protein [Streptomyces sp. NBC_01429]